jgi:hypothetical protein
MKPRQCFIAKLSAVCVLFLGTTATNFALAAKTAPVSHHGDRASTKHGSAPAPVTPRSAPVTPRAEHSKPGEVGSATKSEWGPIDTRITVLNGLHSRSSAKTHDWKKSNIARPPGPRRANYQAWKRSDEDRIVKNAIGLPVRQPNVSPNAPVVKNAIGLPVRQPNASRTALIVKNAIGLPVRQPNATAKKPINTQLTASINRSVINGTGMGRPGSGSVAIGGAKRKVAGVIDGTNFRPRRP